MDELKKNLTDIGLYGPELINKSYQLQGVLSNIPKKAQGEHSSYLEKTVHEIRSIGKKLQSDIITTKQALERKGTNESQKTAKDRKDLALLKKENYRLKKEIDELKKENSLYSMDEDSFLSSQEASQQVVQASNATASTSLQSSHSGNEELLSSTPKAKDMTQDEDEMAPPHKKPRTSQ
ncbi:hypothetical protein FSP39_001477 [Pinctada imbricata]|uniref:Uncharacterized protein n=1 Tax=Pinctada imbricata TaxID=66713 RepID=A0AA89BL50_PINIB|nr:hypothetical protein FSP39_020909 [Pinctada imbricata]KAK3099244.1 hypothetical protein FSP39_001477 [Pinctada imbricata]